MNDDDFDNLDLKKIRWNFKNLKEGSVSFWTRFLLRISMTRGVRSLSKKLGLDYDIADKAHDLFENIKKIDVVPLKSSQRGFQLILNRSTALYFYQEDDHFKYDGFEIGEYDKVGNVTIFDNLKDK